MLIRHFPRSLSNRPSSLRLAALLASALLAFPATHASVWIPEGTAHTVTDTPAEQDAKMGWWREARFGMFIHWGLYAVPAGEWNGRRIGGIGEWILKDASIPIADYKALAAQFNPRQFNADQWVAIAKGAGMKYIIITAKHHDGFAMFRSKADPFNIYDATPFKRDPLAELAVACRKAGMKFGFYYSHDQDWTAPGGAVIGKTWDKAQEGNFEDYLRTKSIPQFKELLNNYQPAPDVIWFDTPTTEMTPALARQFIDLIKPAHPNLIWNERLGGGFKGNYRTPENHIPADGIKSREGLPEDWEVCMTMNGTWGFKKHDHGWKSPEVIVRNLADIASKGGNYLLNVGPTAEGVIPAPSVERLAEVGRWMAVNGESIYGTTAAPFKKQPSWGRITRKGDTFYLHVFTWPKDGKLTLRVANSAKSVRLLATPSATLASTATDRGLEISLPAAAPDRISSVVAVTLQGVIEEISHPPIAQAIDGTLTLQAADAEIMGDKLKLEDGREPNLGWWSDADSYARWRVAITRPGTFYPTINYACDNKDAGSEFTVGVDNLPPVTSTVADTGGWKTYLVNSLGQLRIDRPGTYTVSIQITRKPPGHVMNLRDITLAPALP